MLCGIGKTGGLVANAALALVLGLSLNVIGRRVDAPVDAVLLRKRHEDERALLDFSKEAAFVTHPDALLDQAITSVKRHTDARKCRPLSRRCRRLSPRPLVRKRIRSERMPRTKSLAEFAHGVGPALDKLSTSATGANVTSSLAKIESMLERLPDTLAHRMRTEESAR